MANKLDVAVAQFVGFKHGKWGYSATQLANAMGLTKSEWNKIRDEINLDTEDVQDLDEYFEKQ